MTTPPKQPAARSASRESDPRLGSTLGKYLLTDVLGKGGMGVVYEARDTLIGRQVAVKVLPDSLAADAESLKRFQREARAAGRLEHANTVCVYEVGEQDGTHYLVMQLVRGGSVGEFLKAHGPYDWREATRIVIDICRGLQYAHEAGLVHRDIKPANIMRTADGVAKLADFGLAKSVEGHSESLTAAGSVMGTPQYMSPEQCHGERPGAPSDIYSLGGTYYSLLTGEPPYRAKTAMLYLMAHCSQPAPDPRALVPNLPEACAEIVLRAMAKEPAERFADARELELALQAVLESGGRDSAPPTVIGKTQTLRAPARSNGGSKRLPTAVIGAAVGVLSAAIIGIVLMRGKGTPTVAKTPGDNLVAPPEKDSRQPKDPPDPVIVKDPPVSKDPVVKDPVVKDPVIKDPPVVKDPVVIRFPPGQTEQEWLRAVAALPAADDKVERVMARLRQRNPNFNGNYKRINSADGKSVVELEFKSDRVSDLSPLKALPTLEKLVINADEPGLGTPANLSPLKGMKLRELQLGNTQVESLEPLRGMPLRHLGLARTRVSDLAALADMPLESLVVQGTPVRDLRPIRGKAITMLIISSTKVTDLTPLEKMPLDHLYMRDTPVSDLAPLATTRPTWLDISATQVKDITPLKGLPIRILNAYDTRISDLSPLAGSTILELHIHRCPVRNLSPLRGTRLTHLYAYGIPFTDISPLKETALEWVCLDFDAKRDADVLRSIRTLKTINDQSAADFWRDAPLK